MIRRGEGEGGGGDDEFFVQIVVTGLRYDAERAAGVWATWVQDAKGIAPPPMFATAVLGGEVTEGGEVDLGLAAAAGAGVKVGARAGACPEGAPQPCLGRGGVDNTHSTDVESPPPPTYT
jgi:hypothetical protein